MAAGTRKNGTFLLNFMQKEGKKGATLKSDLWLQFQFRYNAQRYETNETLVTKMSRCAVCLHWRRHFDESNSREQNFKFRISNFHELIYRMESERPHHF